jgi:N-acetyl-gamma-glutamyl-phosphate reductase
MSRTQVSIVGASGYTGAELVRLVLAHPRLALAGVYAHKSAGKKLQEAFPQLAGVVDVTLEPYAPESVRGEIACLALPHHESAEVAAALLSRGLRVLDLSADFRLKSRATYEAWYGPHPAAQLLSEAKYGLVERHREELSGAACAPYLWPYTCADFRR